MAIDLRDRQARPSTLVFDAQSPLVVLPDGERFIAVSQRQLQLAPTPWRATTPNVCVTQPLAQLAPEDRVRLQVIHRESVLIETQRFSPTGRFERSTQLLRWDIRQPNKPPVALPVPADGEKKGWSVSPDAQWLAYPTGSPKHDVILVNLGSGQSWTVTNTSKRPLYFGWLLAWSPDAKRLAMSGGGLIRIVDPNTRQEVDVPLPSPAYEIPRRNQAMQSTVFVKEPFWSPDSKWIAGTLQEIIFSFDLGLPGEAPPSLQFQYDHRMVLIDTASAHPNILPFTGGSLKWAPTSKELAVWNSNLKVFSISLF